MCTLHSLFDASLGTVSIYSVSLTPRLTELIRRFVTYGTPKVGLMSDVVAFS